jgi:uncharacterized protein YhfF
LVTKSELLDDHMTNTVLDVFWQHYLDSLPPGEPRPAAMYLAWHFGDNPALAGELADLVLAGVKTATCGMLAEFELDQEPLPQVGVREMITDFVGTPLGIIETTAVEVLPFNRVGAEFAAAEGEGDRSYFYWRDAHARYFTRRCAVLGLDFREDIPVVCQQFRLIYP